MMYSKDFLASEQVLTLLIIRVNTQAREELVANASATVSILCVSPCSKCAF